MTHRPLCIGIEGSPCIGRSGGPRRVHGFGRRCGACHRRWLRARAVTDMRALAGLALPERECQEEQQPERYEDPDGTTWTALDVERFASSALDDDGGPATVRRV